MRRRLNVLLTLGRYLTLALALLALTSLASTQHGPATLTVEYSQPKTTQAPYSAAPNWMLSTPEGEPVMLYDLTEQNKSTVMLFWATWCNQCSKHLPKLQALAREYSDNAQFYILNVWEDKDPIEFLAEKGITLPLLLKAEAVAKRYGVKGTPGLVVVSPEREITLHHATNAPLKELEAHLKLLQSDAPRDKLPQPSASKKVAY